MRLGSLFAVVVALATWPLVRHAVGAPPPELHPAPPVHATLVSSEPPARAHLTSSPPRIRLVFSEPVEGKLARITLVGLDGTSTRLAAGADPRNVKAVIAPLPSLGDGRYRVDWRVVSADGHRVEGTYPFAIGDTTSGEAPPPVAQSDTTTPVEAADETPETWGPAVFGAPIVPAALRGAALGALMIAGGLLLFLSLASGDADRTTSSATRSITTTFTLAAPLLLAGHLVAWLIDTSPDHTLTTAWASAALGTTVGHVELWRTGLAVLMLWAWWLVRRPMLALAFAIGALVVSGGVGHSAAMVPFAAVPAKAIHLLGGAIWAGGLVWLAARPSTDRTEWFVADAGRVSALALVAVLAVGISGVVQTLLFLPRLGDVLTSPYGWLALAKAAGLAVLAGFGAYHRQRVMPRLADAAARGDAATTLRASVARELTVMAIVVMLGGLLAYVPPPEEGGGMTTATASDS